MSGMRPWWLGSDDIAFLSLFGIILGVGMLVASIVFLTLALTSSSGAMLVLVEILLGGVLLISLGGWGLLRVVTNDKIVFKTLKRDQWVRYISFFVLADICCFMAAVFSMYIGLLAGLALSVIIIIFVWVKLFGVPERLKGFYL